MGNKSRRKGHDFERWVAAQLRKLWPTAERGLQYRDGAGCPDVRGCPPYHIECKRGARPSPRAALRQATEDAQNNWVPVAIIKDDRESPFVVMHFRDWYDLVDGCGICEWRQCTTTGAWHTGCLETWEFNEGGPEENGTRYCPYCGCVIRVCDGGGEG
jgi:hypothetical protein